MAARRSRRRRALPERGQAELRPGRAAAARLRSAALELAELLAAGGNRAGADRRGACGARRARPARRATARDRAAALLRGLGDARPRAARGPRRRRWARSPGGRPRCSTWSARASPTPRSPSGCTSRPRRPSTTSAGCSPSSGSAAGPRRRRSPCVGARRPPRAPGFGGCRIGVPPDVRSGVSCIVVAGRGSAVPEQRRPPCRPRSTRSPPTSSASPPGRRRSRRRPGSPSTSSCPRRGAVPLPHRDAPALTRSCRRRSAGSIDRRRPALDLLRPRRGRRVRRHEPVPRRRAGRPGRPRRAGRAWCR